MHITIPFLVTFFEFLSVGAKGNRSNLCPFCIGSRVKRLELFIFVPIKFSLICFAFLFCVINRCSVSFYLCESDNDIELYPFKEASVLCIMVAFLAFIIE